MLSPGRSELTLDLAAKVQAALDEKKAGVEVVAIEIPNLRPSGTSAESFEELGIGLQGKQKFVAEAERNLASTFTYIVGDNSLTQQVIDGIDTYNRLKADSPDEAAEKRVEVEQLLVRGGGAAAQTIADAERDRWVQLMSRKAQVRVRSNSSVSPRRTLAAYRARAAAALFARGARSCARLRPTPAEHRQVHPRHRSLARAHRHGPEGSEPAP